MSENVANSSSPMDGISPKEWLKQYPPLSKEVAQLARRIKELETAMYYPQSPSMEGTIKGSWAGDKIERSIQQKEKLIRLYEKKREALMAMLAEIESAIDVLTPTERMLVRNRYIEGMTWEEVCVAMGYSWTQTHRIHSAALVKLTAAEERKAQG